MSPSPPAWQVWTALGLVYVVWGSTYLAIRYLVEGLPPLLAAGSRFAVAAVLLLGWVLLRRGPSALVAAPRAWGAAGLSGLLLLLGGNGLVTLAERDGLPSGLTALLIAVVPLFIVVLRGLSGDRARRSTVAGVLVGLLGLAVLLLPGARPEGLPVRPAVLVVLAALLWSLGSFAVTKLAVPRDALAVTVAQQATGGLAMICVGLLSGERLELERVTVASVVAWVYLVTFGSLVAFTAYSWLLGVAPVSKVATYAYVNPVVAVALGALIAGEAVPLTTAVGGSITLLAVAVVVRAESGRRKAESPLPEPVPEPATAPSSGRDGSAAR